jgi:VWFA-related protein
VHDRDPPEHRRRIKRVLLEARVGLRAYLALAALSGAWTIHAQQRSQPTFRTASDLVVIDLVAVDSRGRFISDLRPEEIEIREDGRRQQVQLLRLVGRDPDGLQHRAAPTGSPPPSAAPVGTLAPAPPIDTAPRRLVIVIDTLSLPIDAPPRIREALLKASTELPEAMPVMLATVGRELVVRQPFTTDRQALAAALSSFTLTPERFTTAADVFETVDRTCAAAIDQQRVRDAAIETGERLIREADARSAATSASLADLLAHVGTIEGRKHLAFYSSGHAISPLTEAVNAVAAATSGCTGLDPMAARRRASAALGRLSSRDTADGLRAAIDRANRAQTTFYTLDPSGLTTDAVLPQSRGSSRAAVPFTPPAQLRSDGGHDYLQALASETGGLTIKSNDMAAVLKRAWEDAGQYYLLGYTPTSAGSDRPFRQLTVSVKRSGVDVRYRKGYFSMSNAPAVRQRSLTTALTNPLGYQNEHVVVSPMIEAGNLSIEVLFPQDSIRFAEVDGQWRADITVGAELRDSNGRVVAGTEIPGKDIELRLSADEYARIQAARNLQTVLTAPAPRRGNYLLTVAVRDSAGWMAARLVPCCATSPPAGFADGMLAADVVAQSARYVDEFVGRLSNVVIDETLDQALTAPPLRSGRIPSPGTTTRRRLVAEFLLVRPAGTVFWIPFRDVVEVDGRPLTDRRDRLMRLFVESGASGTAQAARIAAAGAAHQLGPRSRTTTNPVIALAFLQPHHQQRFSYGLEKSRNTTSPHRVILRFEEGTRPTLMRTDDGQDLPIRGAFEIDTRTGTVIESELMLKTFAESVVLRTRYAFNDRLQMHIPSEMTETHLMRNGAKLETRAHYGRVRTFAVSTTEGLK